MRFPGQAPRRADLIRKAEVAVQCFIVSPKSAWIPGRDQHVTRHVCLEGSWLEHTPGPKHRGGQCRSEETCCPTRVRSGSTGALRESAHVRREFYQQLRRNWPQVQVAVSHRAWCPHAPAARRHLCRSRCLQNFHDESQALRSDGCLPTQVKHESWGSIIR